MALSHLTHERMLRFYRTEVFVFDGKLSSMLRCKPHCWLKPYEVHAMHYLEQVPGMFKTEGPNAD